MLPNGGKPNLSHMFFESGFNLPTCSLTVPRHCDTAALPAQQGRALNLLGVVEGPGLLSRTLSLLWSGCNWKRDRGFKWILLVATVTDNELVLDLGDFNADLVCRRLRTL